MPTMIIASTAIDQVSTDPTEARTTVLRFLPTDSALFFTSDEDRILLKKQKGHFNPLIRWANKTFGLELATTQMIGGKLNHPTLTTKRVRYIVEQLVSYFTIYISIIIIIVIIIILTFILLFYFILKDPYELTCLQTATMECKSILMGLGLLYRFIDYSQAKEMSRIEEEFQAEIWGTVEGGHDMDRLNNLVNLSSVDSFMTIYWDRATLENKLQKLSSELKQIV